ncbi:MAG: hypothetical protein KAV87_54240 [Desulfobacteraceae bacterium]|nr:hypothetical protein [Desulfobacteraceae bacterium]
MTTTLADLLAGVDMEGGENFCDDVYNFLKNQGKDINLLTNSGFGVWSQSDANKGLAELVFDNGTVAPVVGETIAGANATGKVIWVDVTDDDWAGNNGAGTAYLGAVSGAYIDNETIVGNVAASFDVAGDLNIGVKNDPMNNDSIAAVWTQDANMTLAFLAAEYSVNTTAINQHAWIVAVPLTAGKIYKIELDIKDGNVTDDIQGYFHDGVAQYGRLETTGGAWASVAWVFECATTTAAGLVGFRVPANLGGGNTIQIRRFSCYEITPCCTVADNKACDGWYKDATCDIYRQHWDSTYSKCGSFYSLKIVPSHADDYVRFPGAFYDNEEWYKQFCGQPVTVGAWVYASVASHAKLVIQQTSGDTSSAYHSGTPGWEWLEVTEVIAVDTAFFNIQLFCDAAPNVDGTTIVYISQDIMVFGWSLGEGMYQPRLQEWIACEKGFPDNILSGGTFSDTAATTLNIEATTDARFPKGCKAIKLAIAARDLLSAGNDVFIYFTGATTIEAQLPLALGGITNDQWAYKGGEIACNSNGDIFYTIDASAAGNLDIAWLRFFAVRVN